jgi:hypothetical protein
MNFDPLFKDKRLLIHKECINKSYVKLNGASDNIAIILFIGKYLVLYLIKHHFFLIFKMQ